MAVTITRHKFTVEEYHRMAEQGILNEDDRVELIDGEVVEMSPIGPSHVWCVNRLTKMLVLALSERAIVHVQNPVVLPPYSEPQPDLALLRMRPGGGGGNLPTPKDVLLAVEVADTTYETDRWVKVPKYAEAGIPEVWLFDLANDRVEVFRRPGKSGYRSVRRLGRGQTLEPQAFPGVAFSIDEALGEA